MSKISSKCKEKPLRAIGDHCKFLTRIKKTLYYGRLPKTDRLSLPVTELTAELFSEAKVGHSLDRLHFSDAAAISRNACVSPCSLILAMLYLERLKIYNPDYLQRIAPSELFLVSLMVSSKFLYDDGEEDEVFMDEWAISGGISVQDLVKMEKEFLKAIQWELYVNEMCFWQKLKALECFLANREGTTRGWFTYTELNTLVENIDVQKLLHGLASLFSILMTTYTAGLLTIFGSMLIVSYVPGNCLQNRYTQVETNKTYLAAPENAINESEENALDTLQNELNTQLHKKPLDAVDVFKTSIILASIQSYPAIQHNANIQNSSYYDFQEDEDDNVQYVTWNWWKCPTMDWLTKTSKLIENFDFIPKYNYSGYFAETCQGNYKKIELEDQIHKATKMRMQDQMEMSWHMEWTDSIRSSLLSCMPLTYFQNVNA